MSTSELLEVYLEKEGDSRNDAGGVVAPEKRLFACTLCPYRTDRRNNLKRHTSTMHEQSAAVLECCGTRFANKAALRHHTTAYHRNGYICGICGRGFCRRALLRRHHSVHSGFKEFACNLCDYATSHKSNLERHMKIHEGSPALMSASLNKVDADTTDAYSDEDVDDAHLASPSSIVAIVRDHNPILASLLSQPTSHGDLNHWNYRQGPYDYSMAASRDTASSSTSNHGALGPTPSPTQPDVDAQRRRAFAEELKRRQSTVIKDNTNSQPLRHAIDVILGVKSEPVCPSNQVRPVASSNSLDVHRHGLVTTAFQNHWSIGHVTSVISHNQSLGLDLRFIDRQMLDSPDRADRCYANLGDSGVDWDRSSVGSKRRWDDTASLVEAELTHSDPQQLQARHPRCFSSPDEDDDRHHHTDQDAVYIPKKLRMSKRYQ